MFSFKNDYSEGMHPSILEQLAALNDTQLEGYALDSVSEEARNILKKEMNNFQCDIHFIHGGTAANLTVISACLRPYEAVIAPESGHICVHESGAIEATGHKVISVAAKDGKLTPEMIRQQVNLHTDEHMVLPRMVYISNPTEIGTIYNKEDLTQLRECCNALGLILYMDGARLGSALMAKGQDLTLGDISRLCDVFYIGGTKNGAMMGEAVVIGNHSLKAHFRYGMKQRGVMLAKGWMIGVQFACLFREGVFYQLADHANGCAQKIANALKDMGVDFFVSSPTNQIFPILPHSVVDQLEKEYLFYRWQEMPEDKVAIRLVTSWATPAEETDCFIHRISQLVKQ